MLLNLKHNRYLDNKDVKEDASYYFILLTNLRILEPDGVREAAIKGVATAPAGGAKSGLKNTN